ncbi:MAG: nucleoside 2-deoxyribosyltransferase [Planctomycetes bacterium]|nr:nucleoside 2-deoxyribosyltransferase [Planctomycetota bacterium]MBU1517454.1 nucleoside 2-deoxyribosyltransferase [Planctomycetota bacterium]MBU2457053.1 nucleoside 2-deoxyribosyltransferase [Planctomycetota bacterium]MBU2596485.1 nucleoside 2-deoxyribosyltransferase [Planctomycetota bacterium]
MEERSYKIYCAGPLFNPKEREEMASIASALRSAGYNCFLPQENGLEFAKLLPSFIAKNIHPQQAVTILNMAIFSLDVFEIMDSDGLVLNLNGRVPDEGAMVEAGIAWANSKSLVIFKNDDRSLIQGNCNPLVMGLSNFEYVENYEDIPITFTEKFKKLSDNAHTPISSKFEAAKQNGRAIREYLSTQKTLDELTELLISLFGEIECQNMKIQTKQGILTH